MVAKDWAKLKVGDFVHHRILGVCYVDSIVKEFDAITIRPLTDDGVKHMFSVSLKMHNRLLEDSKRSITGIVQKPNLNSIPYHIIQIQSNGRWIAFKWNEEHWGDIDKLIKVKDLNSWEELTDFLDMLENQA